MLLDLSFTRDRITFWDDYHFRNQTGLGNNSFNKKMLHPQNKSSAVKAILKQTTLQENQKKTSLLIFNQKWTLLFYSIDLKCFLVQHNTFKSRHLYLATFYHGTESWHPPEFSLDAGTKLQGALTRLMAGSISWEIKPSQQW